MAVLQGTPVFQATWNPVLSGNHSRVSHATAVCRAPRHPWMTSLAFATTAASSECQEKTRQAVPSCQGFIVPLQGLGSHRHKGEGSCPARRGGARKCCGA